MECPECGSEDTEPMELDDDEEICYWVCENCGYEWEEETD